MPESRVVETGASPLIPVVDPIGVTNDPAMPFLRQALDPLEVEGRLQRSLRSVKAARDSLRLRAIRVSRYKPGRRCLIEYDAAVSCPGAPAERLTLIGKARAKGLAARHYQIPEALWDAGFSDDSRHGVSVPRVAGAIPEFHMWLQHKAPGATATSLLLQTPGIELAERIAEAAFVFHQASIPTRRRHTVQDELRALQERLMTLAGTAPRWRPRLERILRECAAISAVIPQRRSRGIHRDFYPDQIIVDGSRLFLLDLDLYCAGDPALDIGNFSGHLTELSLRALGRPDALDAHAAAMEERYCQLDGETGRAAIRVYATLTLARHIQLSTRFPERRWLTEALLELVERRLDADRALLAERGALGPG